MSNEQLPDSEELQSDEPAANEKIAKPTIESSQQAIDEKVQPEIQNTDQSLLAGSMTSTPKLQTQDMEVHHHPDLHHKPKPWKEYLLEFIMIFLAVTLGFIAENLREHLTDSRRELELARALYTELQSDSAVAAKKISIRVEKEIALDTIACFFRDSMLTSLPKKIYPLFMQSLYLFNTYSFEPKDGILSQLRNSGSLRYLKSIQLQKLLGEISVDINNVRYRNDQEYQFFASPIKPFLLKHFDFKWLDILRKEDTNDTVLAVMNHYLASDRTIEAKILNLSLLDRIEASNMVMFYKQMMVSTRSLQMNNYALTNHKILKLLRENYSINND